VRLLTRSDFDGSVCAAILQELEIVDEILYIHPKDLQDNKIDVSENDIIANVPFVEGCGLWFDHHSSEHERLDLDGKINGASERAPSAAHVIYNYYIHRDEYAQKLKKFEKLIEIVGIADSARFTREDILNPAGWIMLAFISDPRTGMGYKRNFRISNFDLMKRLPDLLRTKSVEEILQLPDFQERIRIYQEENDQFKQLLLKKAFVVGNAVVIDFRGIHHIPVGNRFLEYVLYPEQNISVRLTDIKNNDLVMISVGHSIINRTCIIDVGSLSLKYGGGGHISVGTCQVKSQAADQVLNEMLQSINSG
jgi:oligoribonuclease NrnB/cAMP/cGMP phosphodiesterase (DHH superfamily)